MSKIISEQRLCLNIQIGSHFVKQLQINVIYVLLKTIISKVVEMRSGKSWWYISMFGTMYSLAVRLNRICIIVYSMLYTSQILCFFHVHQYVPPIAGAGHPCYDWSLFISTIKLTRQASQSYQMTLGEDIWQRHLAYWENSVKAASHTP